MTSLSKINVNRANAKLSTVPKSAFGRRRVSRNAHRHGLSIPILLDPTLAREVHALSQQLAKDLCSLTSIDTAYAVAEAEIDLKRIRQRKADYLQKLNSENDLTGAKASQLLEQILRLGRYERRALARRKSAILQLTNCREANLEISQNWQNKAKKVKDFKGGVTNAR